LITRLDLAVYLLLIVTVLIVTFTTTLSLLAALGVTSVNGGFLRYVPAGRGRNVLSLALGVGPLAMFMYAYQRYAVNAFRAWEIPAVAVLFALYTYVWIFASVRALARISVGRWNWIKTPRVPELSLPADETVRRPEPELR